MLKSQWRGAEQKFISHVKEGYIVISILYIIIYGRVGGVSRGGVVLTQTSK